MTNAWIEAQRKANEKAEAKRRDLMTKYWVIKKGRWVRVDKEELEKSPQEG